MRLLYLLMETAMDLLRGEASLREDRGSALWRPDPMTGNSRLATDFSTTRRWIVAQISVSSSSGALSNRASAQILERLPQLHAQRTLAGLRLPVLDRVELPRRQAGPTPTLLDFDLLLLGDRDLELRRRRTR